MTAELKPPSPTQQPKPMSHTIDWNSLANEQSQVLQNISTDQSQLTALTNRVIADGNAIPAPPSNAIPISQQLSSISAHAHANIHFPITSLAIPSNANVNANTNTNHTAPITANTTNPNPNPNPNGIARSAQPQRPRPIANKNTNFIKTVAWADMTNGHTAAKNTMKPNHTLLNKHSIARPVIQNGTHAHYNHNINNNTNTNANANADANANANVNANPNANVSAVPQLTAAFANSARIFQPKALKQPQNTGIDDRLQGKISVKQFGKYINNQEMYHASNFESFESLGVLKPELLTACAEIGFTHPSKIQAVAIPCCLKFKANTDTFPNLIGQAHHGTGKTATFSLIMLQRTDSSSSLLQALCIVHSRELANQNADVCRKLGKHIPNLEICCGIPGCFPPKPWHCQICIGTPGSLLDKWINPHKRQLHEFLREFKVLVVDEADEFLNQERNQKPLRRNSRGRGRGRGGRGRKPGQERFEGGLYDQFTRIIQDIRLNTTTPVQTLLFSATFPPQIRQLAVRIAPEPIEIKVAPKDVALNNILVLTITCASLLEKFNVLLQIISSSNCGQMIVFANSIKCVQFLVQALQEKHVNIPCSELHGSGMKAGDRDRTMAEFREGDTVCLVASNVIARGIDVPAVGLVVNFEIPFDAETFMHRVGRCGRFGQKGVCLNFVLDSADSTANAMNTMGTANMYNRNNNRGDNNNNGGGSGGNNSMVAEQFKLDTIAKQYCVNVQHFKCSEIEKVLETVEEWLPTAVQK